MISRDQAREIAHSVILAKGLGIAVRQVVLSEEITWSLPKVYGGPALSDCWVVYADQKTTGLGASAVVLLSKLTGDALYAGSANDEG